MARVRQPGAAAAASFGQSGSVYAANGDVVVAPEGKAIVAIQLLANSTFTTLAPVTETTCFNTAGEGYVSGEQLFLQLKFFLLELWFMESGLAPL